MEKHIVIIGAGPGGQEAALKAAKMGAKVTLIEKNELGGVCLNCGCIPSKTWLSGAHNFASLKEIAKYSTKEQELSSLSSSYDFSKIQQNRQAVIARLKRGLDFLYKQAKVNLIKGEAKIKDGKTIIVNGQEITFDALILACGSSAFYPPSFESFKDKLLDNAKVFNLEKLPKSITILGGGAIGCEFACFFNALGIKVVLVEKLPSIVQVMGQDISRAVKTALEKRGIEIKTGIGANALEIDGENKIIILENGDKIVSEEVLIALGRKVDLSGLNLESLNIPYDRKGVKVDPQTMQIKDNIYAVGDITGLSLLAHAASAQASAAVNHILTGKGSYNNDLIPSVLYTWPEAASVGLTKEKATFPVKVHKSFYLANGRALSQNESEGFAQILTEEATNKIVGAQIVGVGAGEMIHLISLAIKKDMTLEDFADLTFAHPTLSEVLKEAALK